MEVNISIVSLVILILVETTWCAHDKLEDEEDNSKNFINNDFARIISDINEYLGLKSIFTEISTRLKITIIEARRYTREEFDTDWKQLRDNPGLRNFIHFVRKVTWPAVVLPCIKIIDTTGTAQLFFLKFLKKKCDIYIGKNALLHPWNMLMEQNKQQLSMVVFAYFMALSFVFLKILSWWNFMVYLACVFLAYSFGGQYLVFKWLLTVTGVIWFVVDLLLKYPLQVAILIIVVFILSYVKGFFLLPFIDNTVPSPRRNSRERMHNGRESTADKQHIQRDFHVLTSRLDGMEIKTDVLADKLEQLTKSMEKLMSDDEGDF